MGSQQSFGKDSNHERFTDHPNLQTNEVITHRIKTDDLYLYFQPHNPSHTFHYLSKQYQMYRKKSLILSNTKVSFPPQMPVGQLDKNFQLEKTIEYILDILQKKESEDLKIDESKLKQVNTLIQQKSSNLLNTIKDKNLSFKKLQKLQKGKYKQIKLRINNFGSKQIITQSYFLNIKKTYSQMLDDLYNIMNNIEKDQNKQSKQKMQQSSQSIKSIKDIGRKFIQIYDHHRNIVDSNKHNQSISSKIGNQITVLFHSGVCQFLDKSKLLQYKDKKFVQVPLEKAVQNKDKFQIAGLNIKPLQITHSPFFQLQRKDAHPKHFFQITLQAEQISQKKQIYFHKNQLVLNHNLDWIRVQQLKVGMNIYGISDIKMQKTILFTITLISPSSMEIDSTISISSPSYLNIVIDGVIVHNQNKIKIFCNEINQSIMKRYQKPVFPNLTFNDYFAQNQPCFYAGHQINKNQTFADYCLEDKDQIYIKKYKQMNFRQLTISVRISQRNIKNYTVEQQQIQHLFHKLKSDYLGIWNNNVVSFSRQQLEELVRINGIIHIIGEINGYLSKLHFFQNKILSSQISKKSYLFQKCKNQYPQVTSQFQYKFSRYQELKRKQKQTVTFKQQDFYPIFLYTTRYIYYLLNKFLRQQYQKIFFDLTNYKISQEKWVPITNWLMKSLQILPNYQGICYRGMKDVKLNTIFAIEENNQTVCFNAFNSTSILQEQSRMKFTNDEGILMTIISRTGKQITSFSKFAVERQVLFPPFTNFLVISYNDKARPQEILLEEILVSKSNNKNLLFWVDDQPQNNLKQIKDFENRQIQVIQVTSTRVMQILMKRFYRNYKILGKKMAIISDMARFQYSKSQGGKWKEQKKENKQAGIQLLELIYNKYGLTVKSFIYTSPQYVQDILATIKNKELPSDKISVIGYRFELIEKVYSLFQN